MQYNRALVTGGRPVSGVGDEAAVWEEELVKAGVPVYARRLELLPGLLDSAGQHCRRFGIGEVAFEYRRSVPGGTDVAAVFRQRLAATRPRAAELGFALAGPHRDDVGVVRQGRDLRRYGSVGEQRLAAIALRLAEADLLADRQTGQPVFLMDEVASELDERNSRLVFELVAERGQSLYAAARQFPVTGKVFRVETGKVEAVS
jgi:DNA replication and repair protein RecF